MFHGWASYETNLSRLTFQKQKIPVPRRIRQLTMNILQAKANRAQVFETLDFNK